MPAGAREGPRGIAAWIDDRWNPILVKEVRQALRGKFFRVCFVITLVAVLIVSAGMMVSMGEEVSHREGRDFFFGIFVCLASAVLGLVPFSAFNAMGAEWDENTFDLLIISNLTPRKIVFGKLLCASVQALLYFSAFTPFLVFSFLLRGIDLLAVAVILAGALVASTSLSVLAIAMSTLSRQKFARIVLMALLSGMLVGATIGSIATCEELLRNPGQIREAGFSLALLGVFLAVVATASFCNVLACNMLAHAEENRSTGMRALTTMALIAAMGFIAYLMYVDPAREALSVASIFCLGCLLLPATFFTTEPEMLGRRVAPRVSKNRLLALLETPYLPGGGRGMIFFLLHMAFITAFCLVMHRIHQGPGQYFLDKGAPGIFVAVIYALVYVGLPSGFLSRMTNVPRFRIGARICVPVLALTFAFVPALAGFFLQDRSLVGMKHAGNPGYLMLKVWDGALWSRPGIVLLVGGLAALALAVNARRIVRGFAEVLAASADRARKDKEDRVPLLSGGEPTDAVA